MLAYHYSLTRFMTHNSFHLSDYDFALPPEQIAQHPVSNRDQSKLLIVQKSHPQLEHKNFSDILDYLNPNDLLVMNTSKVFPARLFGHKQTGGKVEVLLLQFPVTHTAAPEQKWQEATAPALIRSSKRPKVGTILHFSAMLHAQVTALHPDGKAEVCLRFQPDQAQSLEDILEQHGQLPLPPYISRPAGNEQEDRERYQTRYARHTGSVAAPTAGLHFSDALLEAIRHRGIAMAEVILHVGYGTFAPVRAEDIRNHTIHEEWVEIPAATAEAVNQTKANGGRIWAIGTTTVRSLEFAADDTGRVVAGTGKCRLFIYPGYHFRVVDNLVTNFHLPKSSLLFLVSALVGRSTILAAYAEAITSGYRFFSYGDAMAIINKA